MTLSREQKIEKARDLRQGGALYREIAEELDVSVTTVCEWITGRVTAWKKANPERVREQNLRRNDAKREWEDAQRADCPQCGQRMGAGSAMPASRPDKCAACHRDDARLRTVHFINLRSQGLTNREIARAEGVRENVVASVLSRADRFNLDVPPSPYRSRRNQGQVAA